MTSEQWQQIKTIVQQSLETEPGKRARFVAEKCGDNASLRDEVGALLTINESIGDFIETPAYLQVMETLPIEEPAPELTPGQRLGHYEVIRELGRGGMGTVYLAQDNELGRKVALKILPSGFSDRSAAAGRFRREARVVSALNHPNILTIHEIGQIDSIDFITTEFVDGVTLRHRIAGNPMKPAEAIEVSAQVAAALAEAHAAGIIHRDIKPENIMIRRDGLVKVLDFGIAKLADTRDGGTGFTALSENNSSLAAGTPKYMSPEQLRGQPVDARSDLWSFGIVLYEALTGHVPDSDADDDLVGENPEQERSEPLKELHQVVRRCLERDTASRYQSAQEVLDDLKGLQRAVDDGAEAKETAQRTRVMQYAPVAVVISMLVLVSVALVYFVSQITPVVSDHPEIKSIAVLPLKSLDAGENYLGLGIADAVIRRINQTGKLIVRPTSAVRHYLNEDTDALTAARQLNADAVLEGSVQHAGDRLRVSVNLLRTSDGASLWADNFDMSATDIFTIQDTVAQQVASRLQLQLDPSQQARLTKRYTSNPIAYEYYVKGIYSLDQRGWGYSIQAKPQMEATIALFKQAIGADPQYALAHAQLAYAYAWMAIFIELDPIWVEHARQEMSQAEALDPQLAETHVARHLILWSAFEGFQTEAAIHELLLAQQLNTSIGHLELGVLYWHIGLEDQASRKMQRALEIDPTSENVKGEFINSKALAGRIDEGLAAEQRFFNRGPGLKYYLDKNMLSDAQPLLEQALVKDPNDPIVRLRKALFLALKGNFHAAEAEIPWILENIRKDRSYHHHTYEIARVYALAGKSDEAVKWLRQTAATGLPCYPLFERDAYLNRIRQAPEFIQFMAEMKALNERYRSEFEQAP